MDMLKVFEKAEFGRVRVVECEGEPWFHGGERGLVELHEVTKAIVVGSETIDERLKIGNAR
ncbi:hypothetical protein [Bilophila wadsworthia]|uniref:hypothetical protein n=1 Tax=Bilophila wadsworthia TaxID=35833 RepID=UPI00266D4C2C|nr:hypothetical protein [Bilophila wadsworthia]